MNGPLLEVSDLSVVYRTYEGTVAAVNGLGFSLHRGRTLGLVGESGAGKTTTALSIMGLVPSPPGVVESGRIIFDGQDLLRLPEREMKRIRGNRISMIFQDPMTSLNPVLTVGLQISEALAAHQDLSEAEAERRAAEMLERVQIPAARYREYPHEFSGGMRQRVVIAMALACNPSLIIADEPTTALDVTIQAQVLELMKSLKEEFATSMIMITHDLGVVGEVCDNVAVMYAGRILELAPTGDLFSRPLHPYTRGLLESIPRMDDRVETLKAIPGMVPSLESLSPGCKFSNRCRWAAPVCEAAEPAMEEARDGHFVRCVRWSEIAAGAKGGEG